MLPIFTLIPLETKIAILILVILPAILVFSLRVSLHKKLQDLNHRISRLLISGEEEGIQPEIVKRLRTRYRQASQKLEHVNTIALIDSIYKEERIDFLIKTQFDRADNITRALPNLLISFGLIGTFLGITSNLTNISEIVTSFSTGNSNIGGLVQGLQKPLQDMGIAFSSSLFGLLFGSLLTIANTIWNTSIAKNQLIASLEDYLDNIYKPTVEGNTRLDTAIDRMVKQQQEFLERFHENVGVALERSFGKAADRIADECGRINQIAENVYTSFANAAGTIATGATTFQYAATAIESQTKILTASIQEFKSGAVTFTVAANQIENNQLLQNLDRILAELHTSQQAFSASTQVLQTSLAGISTSNQTAAQLAQRVYQGLEQTTTSIQSGANNFVNAAQIIRDSSLATDLTNAANQWQNAQTEFTKSTTLFSQATKTFEPVAAKLAPAITTIDRFGTEVVNLSKNTTQIAESTQTALLEFDRNYQKLLNNTDLSIQDLGQVNRTNWQSLINILEPKIQTDRESLTKLLAVIEKLDKVASNLSAKTNTN
jgi:hypothetical protein